MAKESKLKMMGFGKGQRIVSDTYRENVDKIDWKTPDCFEIETIEDGAKVKKIYRFKK